MPPTSSPFCGEHRVMKEWRLTTFEYADKDIVVRIPNVYAWVCPANGEASFTPDTTDELIETANDLLQTAKRARQRRSTLTEYFVSVGQSAQAGSLA